MRADSIAGVSIALAGLVLGLATAGLDVLPSSTVTSARLIPGILAGVLVLSGLAIAVRPGAETLAEVLGRVGGARFAIFLAAFLIYALTFRHADYRLGTALFLAVGFWSLGSRSWFEIVALPVLVAFGTHYVFRQGFAVLLPTWF